MREQLIDFENLSDSRELLEAREPNFMVYLIYFIFCGFLAAFIWMWFGEVDVVVNARGIVRPLHTISIIRNPYGGEIKQLYYNEGRRVHKDELLFAIDSATLDIRQETLKEQQERTARKTALTAKLIDSIKQAKNLFQNSGFRGGFRVGDDEYSNRYLTYQYRLQQLTLTMEKAREVYLTEKKLGNDLSFKHKIEELEAEYRYAELELNKYQSEQMSNLSDELERNQEKLLELNNQFQEVIERISLSRITAPIDGVVQVLVKFNQGDYMPADIDVLKIIPVNHSRFNMELEVQNKDISQLKAGQRIRYRFLALSSKEYGTLEGNIKVISGDATMAPSSGSMYHIEGSIHKSVLNGKTGELAEIKPGMLCEAKIIVRRKKIFYMVLEKLDLKSAW